MLSVLFSKHLDCTDFQCTRLQKCIISCFFFTVLIIVGKEPLPCLILAAILCWFLSLWFSHSPIVRSSLLYIPSMTRFLCWSARSMENYSLQFCTITCNCMSSKSVALCYSLSYCQWINKNYSMLCFCVMANDTSWLQCLGNIIQSLMFW